MAALETVLRISAEDNTAAAFASVTERIDRLQLHVNQIDKVSNQVMKARVESGGVGSFAPPGAAQAEHAEAIGKTKASADKLDTAATSWLESAAEFAAALVGFKTLKDSVSQAVERSHEDARMRAAGMDDSEIAAAAASAKEISGKYPSIPQSDVMGMLRNARSIVGSFAEAAALIDDFAKLRVVARGADSKSSNEELNEEFDQLLKGIEIKGATQTEGSFKTYMEGIAKGLNAFGDTLKPFEYYALFKYGRQATSMLSDDFVLEVAPSLTQELRGAGFGKAVSAFNRAIVENHLEHTSWQALSDWGLVAPEDLTHTKNGDIKGIQPGKHIKDWEVAQRDPYAWTRNDLIPALAAHGITDPSAVAAAIGQIFDNQSASQLVGLFANQSPRIEKDRDILRHALGLGSADEFAHNDPGIAGQGLWNTIVNKIAGGVPVDFFTHLAAGLNHTLNRSDGHSDLLTTIYDQLGWRGPFDDVDAERRKLQEEHAGERAALAQRFPTAFGGGVDYEDALRLTKHRVAESYRYEDAERADPEAHRGAALMGLGERQDAAALAAMNDLEASLGRAISELGAHQQQPLDVTGKVTLDPDSRAEVGVTIKVEEGSVIKFIADAIAHASGSLSASVGRMDSDAAPSRASVYGPR